jgi:hypothetical protein
MGIWPTLAGLDRAEYLEAPAIKKAWRQVAKRWPEILAAAITTIITLAISSFFGLFSSKS